MKICLAILEFLHCKRMDFSINMATVIGELCSYAMERELLTILETVLSGFFHLHLYIKCTRMFPAKISMTD